MGVTAWPPFETDGPVVPFSTTIPTLNGTRQQGGLGTSMGLDKAKSLLAVKGADTFLDLTAKQVRACFVFLCL